jgi:hypothetical protein
MSTYEIRVRLPQGGFADVRIIADNQYQARQLAEAQYGASQVIAVLGEVR